ncbi:hypothetical protein C5B42_02830 [Candidatus Cerribacteria bacterium 'Amazon FNV 2010 28 9']|uniref:YoaR-like putative peptidoglycan binding domain-containing protein n=1 Tax=Candidatus Cerribacteria bacterium 'Amazon FNV 2010 28 9' TaxID=2081795 RepID=A0A317JQ34_9BACT|nr:MAG: hypothetical protein C5B42_02830 [Candidatus Cerribacteria bacterium 'Amazon FNV 2010 28 9']
MKLFHLFHAIVITGLALVSLFFILSTLALVWQTHTPSKLATILHTPSPTTQPQQASLASTITLHIGSQSFATPSASLMNKVPVSSVFDGFAFLHLSFLPQPQTTVVFDTQRVQTWIHTIALETNTPATPSSILVQKKAPGFVIKAGTVGSEVDEDSTTKEVENSRTGQTIEAVLQPVGTVLSATDLASASARIKNILAKPLIVASNTQTQTVSTTDLLSFIALPSGYNQSAIHTYLEKLAKTINSPPQEPDLQLKGTAVLSFTPPRDGITLDEDQSTQAIIDALTQREKAPATTPVTLIVTTTAPTHSLASTNNLGIDELIGHGDSLFKYSIPNRIHNVVLTAQKINAHIVMPGETFSFNKTIGDVSEATGFLQAYVISQGHTVLGDGGGVCQVSSTMFRALLNAGLPITERRGHAYRVEYYEENSQPGFDATVYAPHPDLTFVNDTGSPILVNAYADPKTLSMYVDFYGKKDGRTAEVLNYKKWDETPAPPALYQDDPTLPTGTIKQVDFAAGGLKTSFDYKVTYADGTVKQTNYTTTYTPWQAVYLRGTGSR